MLIGTFCRFSERFCEVTVTVSRTSASRWPAAVCVGWAGCAGCVAASWANAGEANARQMAAVSGKRLSRAGATCVRDLLPDFCIVLLSPDGRNGAETELLCFQYSPGGSG